jgi:hypothetical protein
METTGNEAMKPDLTLDLLRSEAEKFANIETKYDEPTLYGVTDGKAVGTQELTR